MQQYKKLAITTLVIIGLITLGALASMRNLEFSYEFDSFMPQEDEDLIHYFDYREKLGYENEFAFIAIKHNGALFEKEFLNKVEALTDSLKNTEDVISVISPTNVESYVMGPLGPLPVKYIHVNNPDRYENDSLRIYQSEELVGTIFAPQTNAVSLYIKTSDNLSKAKSDSVYLRMKRHIDRLSFHQYHMTGRVVGQHYYIQQMQSNLAIFVLTSFLLLVSFLWITFRAPWGIVIPISIVILTVIWLLGCMALMGKPIDIMTSLLPTILFVVGISDVVHLVSKYLEELRKGHEKIAALKRAVKEMSLATALTSLTTAVGFISLLTTNIVPLREFGIYTSIGVVIAFILAFTMLPAILVLRSKPKVADRTKNVAFWNKHLGTMFLSVIHHRKKYLSGFGVLLVVCLIGVSFVKVDYFILEDLKKDDPLRQSFTFFEEHFSGVRPFEIALSLNDTNKSFFDHEVIAELDQVETYLKEVYKVGYINSPTTLVKILNKAVNGGLPDKFVVPDRKGFAKVSRLIPRMRHRKEFKRLINKSANVASLVGNIEDTGGRDIRLKQIEFEKFLAGMETKHLNYRVTGTAYLLDKNNEYLSFNLLTGLLIAFLIIALIVGVMFRSVKMVLISLIPNMFPLLVVAALMGYTGIDLKVSTSIVFTIAFGIAVDDTIHFLSKFRHELCNGRTLVYALKRTYFSTGKAIIVTSCILCSGFITLIGSSFMSTFYIGLLISVTLLFAVIADVFLLPALILSVFKSDELSRFKGGRV